MDVHEVMLDGQVSPIDLFTPTRRPSSSPPLGWHSRSLGSPAKCPHSRVVLVPVQLAPGPDSVLVDVRLDTGLGTMVKEVATLMEVRNGPGNGPAALGGDPVSLWPQGINGTAARAKVLALFVSNVMVSLGSPVQDCITCEGREVWPTETNKSAPVLPSGGYPAAKQRSWSSHCRHECSGPQSVGERQRGAGDARRPHHTRPVSPPGGALQVPE
jgi:hypothetical protein